MVHDNLMWRRNPEAVRERLPGVQAVLSAFEGCLDQDGLVRAPKGWNFTDWVPQWVAGWPPDARLGKSAVIALQYLYGLDHGIALFQALGQPDIARHWHRLRDRLAAGILRGFWRPEAGLVADDLAGSRFSEHAQCLALLCDLLDGPDRARVVEGLLTTPHLVRATVYFSHYYFEALRHVGELDRANARLDFWRSLPAMGLKTVLEQPEPSRSDCHAWGAHPLFHAYASFLGARPSAPGFARIRVAPQPGPLKMLRGRMPDAADGFIDFDLSFEAGIRGQLTLPDGLSGDLLWKGATLPLEAGKNRVDLA
jgi:hypothetical protein